MIASHVNVFEMDASWNSVRSGFTGRSGSSAP
jgi:hypothetical protein